ncbi:hypothetical protein ASPVEDRAFT_885364 [Aspergillus versicolor CBS 583.65]|uniref:Uncharacterized protein n=1 Tax=Aspergillus versicolor CBS 583.65 TaxID=1036611 RepID=A0A1L9PH74_ASPVE|nr:uncharacterized protein ASPVEDRAFT_885364 [Aspergillus versicolor CBS 583.65]OJJ00805.1 hypothetical protein ASPVEDRAFT_885364 [Aspergillus versicolor CBS 583.65]
MRFNLGGLALLAAVTFCAADASTSPSCQDRTKYTLDRVVPSKDQTSGTIKCCPEGTEFDGKTCSIAVAKCPDGTRRDGDRCISHEPPTCKGPYKPVDGECVTEANPTCEPPTEYHNGHCVIQNASCPFGFHQEGKVCVSRKTPRCGPNEHFNDHACASDDGPTCENGAKHVNGKCVDYEKPYCEGDATFDETLRKCLSNIKPTCPEGFTPKNGQCVSKHEPYCNVGTYNRKTQTCDNVKEEPECPDGTRPQGKHCVQRDPPTCPQEGFVLSTNSYDGSTRCCPRGMGWTGSVCSTKPIDGKCPDGSAPIKGWCHSSVHPHPTCPDQYTLDKSRTHCVWKSVPKCPGNSIPEHGKCVVKTGRECPDGSVPDGDECVFPDPPVCKGDHTRLVDNVCYDTREPKCGENASWDNEHCVSDKDIAYCKEGVLQYGDCVTRGRPTCHEGTHIHGKHCISDEIPQCKEGVLNDDGTCTTSVTPTCPDGSRLHGGKCVGGRPSCSTGFHLNNEHCESNEGPDCNNGFRYVNGKCRRISEEDCGDGYNLVNGDCISVEEPKCGELRFNGTACVGEQARCPQGTYPDGNDCVSLSEPSCPTGFKPHNGRCVSVTVTPKCPDGTRPDPDTQDCVSITKPVCASDLEVYSNGHCILGSGGCVDFQYCSTVREGTTHHDRHGGSSSGTINFGNNHGGSSGGAINGDRKHGGSSEGTINTDKKHGGSSEGTLNL